VSQATTFNKDMNIGEILDARPEAMKVIEKYFGQGCFTCPGMRTESIAFGATMHNVDPDKMVEEINAISESG
jgi:hybrid cluster-associated redox disulfide protein